MADALIERSYGFFTPAPGSLEKTAAEMRQFDGRAREPEYYAALLHVALIELLGPVGSGPARVDFVGLTMNEDR